MGGILRHIFSAATAAWMLVLILVGVIALQYEGMIQLPGAIATGPRLSYADATAKLMSMDRAHTPQLELEGQFNGPLTDTTIERWRDPADGTVCYVYLPIAVAHSQGPSGLVQYGSANIGSLSCFAGPKASS